MSSSGIFNSKATTVVLTVTGLLTVSSGVAGLVWWFYHRLNRATRMDALKEKNIYNIEQLYSTIETLRKEIEELKSLKSSKSLCESEPGASSKRIKSVRFKKTNSILSSTDSEYYSAWSGTEDSSEEFYDFSDTEDFSDETSLPLGDVHYPNEEALQLFERADSLLEGSSEEHQQALNFLLENENEYSNNVEFLWRLAKSCRMTAQGCRNEKNKKELSFKAVEYAKRALAADELSAEAHKWYAISLGSVGDYLGVADKIRNGFTFKEHIDKAMKIKPTDPLLHHLLGRFSYEVSMLSWIERKVAATIYSNLPTGSVEEALAHFENAEKLRSKPWKENKLFLARCYIQLGRYSDAIHWVDQAINVPVVTADDKVAQDELTTLQQKYKGYRR